MKNLFLTFTLLLFTVTASAQFRIFFEGSFFSENGGPAGTGTGSSVSVTPTGGITATDVQQALEDFDARIASLSTSGLQDGTFGDVSILSGIFSIVPGAITADDISTSLFPEGYSAASGSVESQFVGIDNALQTVAYEAAPLEATLDRDFDTADLNRNIVSNSAARLVLNIPPGLGEIGDKIIVTNLSGQGITPFPLDGTVTFLNYKETTTEVGSRVIYEKVAIDTWYALATGGQDYAYTPPAPGASGNALPGDPATGANTAANQALASIDVAYPTTLNANDYLVLVVIATDPAAIIATPSGWTDIANNVPAESGDRVAGIFGKFATGSETGNQTVTTTSGISELALGTMMRFEGVNLTTPFESVTQTDLASTNTLTSNPVTSSAAGGLHLDVVMYSELQPQTSTPANMALLVDNTTNAGSDGSLQVFRQTLGAATQASQSYTWTTSGAAYGGAVVSFVLLAQ